MKVRGMIRMDKKNWQDYLNILNNMDQNWADKIVNDKKIDNYELGEQIGELLNELKDISKTNDGLPKEVRDQLSSKKELLEWIERWLENALQGYRGFGPVRALAAVDEESARNLLRTAFDNYVLRYDQKIIEKYPAYKLDREEMVRVLRLLDSITDFYVLSHMTKIAIREDFEDETGLNDELCDFYASLVDENYGLLLMNYIAESLANIQRKEPTV